MLKTQSLEPHIAHWFVFCAGYLEQLRQDRIDRNPLLWFFERFQPAYYQGMTC